MIHPSLLLNVFQSVAERAPVVVEFAVRIPNTPVRLLYVSGHTAERAVSPILVATVDERVAREPEKEVRLEERILTVPERALRLLFVIVRLEFVVARLPERLVTLLFVVARFVVRVAILPVAVARLAFVVARLAFVVAILPVIEAMFEFIPATVPERAFCARIFVK